MNAMPLVTILMPAHAKPAYFQAAVESVLAQTYKNWELVISDDMDGEGLERVVAPYRKDSRIKYFHHAEFTLTQNWRFCRKYENDDTVYVNWLMSDDIFLPQKLEKMVAVYEMHPEVTLVTSARQGIDGSGRKVSQDFLAPIVPHDAMLDGESVGRQMLVTNNDFIGEPTTVLIRKKDLRRHDLGWHDLSFTGREDLYRFILSDVATWCQLLSRGNMVYFHEPLSCRRAHEGQASYRPEIRLGTPIAWAFEIQYAWRKKIFLKTEEQVRSAILNWMPRAVLELREANRTGYQGAQVRLLERIFHQFLEALMNGYHIDFYMGEDVLDE